MQQMQADEKFEIVAKTFQGLEDVLRDELISLGAEDVEMGRRMVSFTGNLEMLYKANLCLRTAVRVLKPIAKFRAANPDELYDFVRDFDWDKYLTVDKTFSIDSTVNSSEFPHSKFVTYRVKDGIVDYFNDKYQERPSIRLSGADLQLNVHISDDRVTISMDSSGDPLNQRGYRVAQTEAPINEVLAAGIIMKTGWKGDCDFVDPMCGSGTFLIEAALIAANINPGIFRQHYAFETWPDFDKELFGALYNDDSEEREPGCKIYGGDIARAAIDIARRNIEAAGVEEWVSLECKPFADWTEPPMDGILVTNPPYGERLKPADIEGLYKSIGSTLKNYFPGYHAWILGCKEEHFHEIGLKPSVKFPILNGSIECELREYVLFEGAYADFKEAGGSVGNKAFNRDAKPKVRRMTDDEWTSETRKFGSKGKPNRHSDRDEKKPRFSDRDDRKQPRRSDRDDFKPRRDRDERKPRREFDDKKGRGASSSRSSYRSGKFIEVPDKGPSLPESSATVFREPGFRSRKNSHKSRNNDNK